MAAHPRTEPTVAANGKGSVATKSLAGILNSPEDVEDGAPLRNHIDWKTTARTLTCLQQKDTASNATVRTLC